jgi:glycosyltransferase
MKKPKAVVFYQYLPPWRIDIFNEMGKYYDMIIVFTNADCEGFIYNRQELLDKLQNINTIFLNNGFKIGNRPVRSGILKLLKLHKPDVVFSHEYSPTSIQIALYRQLKLCKYRYYLTTSDNLKMAEDSSGFKAKARNYVLNHADGIIVYSEAVKKWYADHFPKLKIDICPNIQNPSTLLSYREKFGDIITKYKQQFGLYSGNIILYTGRLVTVKGLDLLLTAFSKIDREDYKLVIVGDGNEKNILKELTRKLKIEQKVIFAGYYSGVELYAWYDLANFFILPSRYEPFGAVVNEALVYGCPVIASKYIGALDFINNSNGKIFDPLNEKEFIETLHDAMDKYAGAIEKRTNLMPCSFDEYVKSFYSI